MKIVSLIVLMFLGGPFNAWAVTLPTEIDAPQVQVRVRNSLDQNAKITIELIKHQALSAPQSETETQEVAAGEIGIFSFPIRYPEGLSVMVEPSLVTLGGKTSKECGIEFDSCRCANRSFRGLIKPFISLLFEMKVVDSDHISFFVEGSDLAIDRVARRHVGYSAFG